MGKKVKTFSLLIMLIAVLSGCGKDVAPDSFDKKEGDDLIAWVSKTTITD